MSDEKLTQMNFWLLSYQTRNVTKKAISTVRSGIRFANACCLRLIMSAHAVVLKPQRSITAITVLAFWMAMTFRHSSQYAGSATAESMK
jgi:hypothetical protein